MGRVVSITLTDYRAIMQWDDDGGSNADITYKIVPDSLLAEKKTPKSDEFENLEEDADVADDSLVGTH